MHKSHPCKVGLPAPPPVVIAVAPAPQVVAPTPVPAPVTASAEPVVDYAAEFQTNVKDIFFDFDKSNIRADQQATLNANIAFFKRYPTVKFDIVSSCDVVGTDKYNDALGQWRVNTVKEALNEVGVFETSATTLGKTGSYCQKPKCQQLNRRVHFEYVK
jgi:peptidoglycan-associated lipoprotein